MHALKSHVLPVVAGAAIVVAGLNVASYAGGAHHAATANRPTARAIGFEKVTATPKAVSAKHRPGGYTFKVPAHTPLPFFFQVKGVPAGRYIASLNVGTTTATPTGPVVPFCSVADSTSLYAVVSYGQDHGDPTDDIAINAAGGIVKLEHKGEVGLACQDADETYNAGHSKNVLVLTPVHRVAALKGTPVAAKTPQHRFGH
jgi:hypothetical protein